MLQTILKYAGAAYLIYLAAAIAMAEPGAPARGKNTSPARPNPILGRGDVEMGQRQGLGHGDRHHHRLCGDRDLSLEHRDADRHSASLVGTASTVAWTLFGSALRPVMTSLRAVRAFNIVMAPLLLASLFPVFMET